MLSETKIVIEININLKIDKNTYLLNYGIWLAIPLRDLFSDSKQFNSS